MLHEPGLTAGDVVCAITTLSFDISVLELFLPLIAGGKAVIGDRATASDGVRLARLIADSGATIVQATPASWRMLLDSGWEGRPGLKVLCGGEPLTRELADRLLDRVAELWNVYGPTETTVWSTVDRVERDAPITVGRPIRNMRMYIVDANMQLVPDGVPGELLIGGVGTGYGYLGRPDLTSDRFIADPFATAAGERLYRTGDVARWRHDGRIEILGRSDNQVKIRGFRIELGEIESALREHPAVKQAVVVAREDRPGDRRLVAYVVPHAAAPQVNDLRVHLRGMLPDYMVPVAFVMLARLPISPNGKVDRRALPAPELADVETVTYVAPRTPEEEQLAQIWQDVLGIERVGIHDDFFALGGHSLLAAQLIARVGRVFGGEVPLRKLFEAPTVAAFAEALMAERVASMDGDALSALLSQVEGLSDEELQALLGSEGGQA
jgi:acyl-coenzyme A synthetase/AMP-(fatty) acid ligase/acyl carrier protein